MRVLVSLVLIVLVVAAAGCGGGTSPKVASLGPSAAGTTATDSATPSGGAGGSGPSTSSGRGGSGMQMQMKLANATKFAACMRKNGVPNFPDPGSGGTISIGPGSGVNLDSPKFQAAQKACQKELPHGGDVSPADQAKMQAAALAFSKCMRAHGVTNFPDPQFGKGRVTIGVKGGPGGGLDPNSPIFKRAQQACQGHLPKLGGGTTSIGGGK